MAPKPEPGDGPSPGPGFPPGSNADQLAQGRQQRCRACAGQPGRVDQQVGEATRG